MLWCALILFASVSNDRHLRRASLCKQKRKMVSSSFLASDSFPLPLIKIYISLPIDYTNWEVKLIASMYVCSSEVAVSAAAVAAAAAAVVGTGRANKNDRLPSDKWPPSVWRKREKKRKRLSGGHRSADASFATFFSFSFSFFIFRLFQAPLVFAYREKS